MSQFYDGPLIVPISSPEREPLEVGNDNLPLCPRDQVAESPSDVTETNGEQNESSFDKAKSILNNNSSVNVDERNMWNTEKNSANINDSLTNTDESNFLVEDERGQLQKQFESLSSGLLQTEELECKPCVNPSIPDSPNSVIYNQSLLTSNRKSEFLSSKGENSIVADSETITSNSNEDYLPKLGNSIQTFEELSNVTLGDSNSLNSNHLLMLNESSEHFSPSSLTETLSNLNAAASESFTTQNQLKETQSLYSVTSPVSDLTDKLQYSTDGELAELLSPSTQGTNKQDKALSERSPSLTANSEEFSSVKGNYFENFRFAQSPTTISRSSSISKRSRSSSSISPRSPRMTFYDDESSFELCREAESIRQYIDSEFLSNLLLKGERDKAAKTSHKSKEKSPKLKKKRKVSPKDPGKVTASFDGKEIPGNLEKKEEVTRARSPLCRQSPVEQMDEKHNGANDEISSLELIPQGHASKNSKPQVALNVESSLVTEAVDSNGSQTASKINFGNLTTEIRLENEKMTESIPKNGFKFSTLKALSDPNSPIDAAKNSDFSQVNYIPVSNIFSLNGANTELLSINSPIPSPSPSPTFARSSFMLNSQFLRSLSASTQELLNSLAISSSVDLDHSPSPTKFPLEESENTTSELENIELALPMLSHTTSLAIYKLFDAAEKLETNSASEIAEKESEKMETISPDILSGPTTVVCSSSLSPDKVATAVSENKDNNHSLDPYRNNYSIDDDNMNIDKKNRIVSNERNFRPIAADSVDEDILLQEKVLDDILAPASNAFSYPLPSPSEITPFSSLREVPTLQELASASLPSAKPISSAILSFSSTDKNVETPERTHLKRRYNSPQCRKTPSPRLSLRDKFERDLHSKPRQKHSKSLSKNARFQKGPNARVNSQEKKDKCTSKLDKSKSESRIGENILNNYDEFPKDERVKSDGNLEGKRQTTVKFAPLNIEIPHYREPEIENYEPMLDDERTSDTEEEFLSPSDEITAEIIRKRLWAGLRSFSVDADILQSYGILTNSQDILQEGLLSSLTEVPPTEGELDPPKHNGGHVRKTSMTAEDIEFLETRKNNRRRGSVAALQELVKENTQLINQIVKQKILEKEGKKSSSENSNSKQFPEEMELVILEKQGQLFNDEHKSKSCDFSEKQPVRELVINKLDSQKTLDSMKGSSQIFSSIVSVGSNDGSAAQVTLSASKQVELESQNKVKDIVVTQKDYTDSDTSCFKMPLSAFCVNASKRNTQAVERHSVVPLDEVITKTQSLALFTKDDPLIQKSSYSSQCPKSATGRLETPFIRDKQDDVFVEKKITDNQKAENKGNILYEFPLNSETESTIKKFSPSQEFTKEIKRDQLNENSFSSSAQLKHAKTATPSRSIYSGSHVGNPLFLSKETQSSLSEVKTSSRSFSEKDALDLSLELKQRTQSSNVPPFSNTLLSSRIEKENWSNSRHASRPITFNPFPKKNVTLHRKEVPIKLGLYGPTSK